MASSSSLKGRHGETDEILRRLVEGKLEVLEIIREGWGFILFLSLSRMDRWRGIGVPWLAPRI